MLKFFIFFFSYDSLLGSEEINDYYLRVGRYFFFIFIGVNFFDIFNMYINFMKKK